MLQTGVTQHPSFHIGRSHCCRHPHQLPSTAPPYHTSAFIGRSVSLFCASWNNREYLCSRQYPNSATESGRHRVLLLHQSFGLLLWFAWDRPGCSTVGMLFNDVRQIEPLGVSICANMAAACFCSSSSSRLQGQSNTSLIHLRHRPGETLSPSFSFAWHTPLSLLSLQWSYSSGFRLGSEFGRQRLAYALRCLPACSTSRSCIQLGACNMS